MDDLFKAISCAEIKQKLDLLPELLSAGTKGIDYLIESLGDRELAIRVKAYELLQNIASQQVQQAIAPGVLFQPRDKIYSVIQSSAWFNDSFYELSSIPDNNSKHLVTEDDYRQQFDRIISFEESAAYVVSTKDYYIDYQQAELAAKKLNQQVISKFSIDEFEPNDDKILIQQWCDRHHILTEVIAFQIEKNRNLGADRWFKSVGLSYDSENIEIYWSTVEQYLKFIPNFDLLEQLWQDLVGNLTCIQKITFDKPTYLKIDPYYSQIIASTNRFVFFNGEEEELFLSLEEFETNLLIKALNNPQLAIRVLAYQLLRGIGIDLETAQQAIFMGIKLNPGDKVYSVYKSGMWFDDQNYNIYDERYLIDYLNDLNYQIYGSKLLDEEEERIKCKRIYCYLEKKQAEVKAETLHREIIRQAGLGIGGFEWCKKNPDFDARQWCSQHNIPYPDVKTSNIYVDDSYQVIWRIKEFLAESGNENLEDNLRRSRYIYHPKHIDTWCNDNNVEYDPSLDKWDNYQQVLEYLYQPKNIALLSKFWKDGVGHFAFVKEEIVQEKIYLKPGEKLSDRPEAEISKIQSSLKPENYPELASQFLINIIESKYKSTEHKSKARELLQNIPGKYLPF